MRVFRFVITSFFILLTIYAIGRPIEIWLDTFFEGEREPYLQILRSDGITIRWQSHDAYRGTIFYGESPDNLHLSQAEAAASQEHEITLNGLKAGTRYYYSVANKEKIFYQGNDYQFKTAPIAGQAVATRFWVTGDQGKPGKIQSSVRDAMLNWVKMHPLKNRQAYTELDFWLTTGDSAYRSGSNKQFQSAFFEPYKRILRNTAIWPVYGNHDARRPVFFNLFSLPVDGQSGGLASASEHYFSFDYGDIHFVILDTQDTDLASDSMMLNWLREDLKQTRQRWLIALFHHPPYSKGTHDSDDDWDSKGRMTEVRENVLPLLESSGVDLVLSGHSHMYERSDLINCHYGKSATLKPSMILQAPNNKVYQKSSDGLAPNQGTIYAVVGSSAKLDRGDLDHPAMPYSMHEAGSMVIDIQNTQLTARFINDKGEIKDQFEIIKGVKKGVQSKPCTP